MNAPVMHTADHKKVEDPGLVQGIVLALILCGVVALVDVGYPERKLWYVPTYLYKIRN